MADGEDAVAALNTWRPSAVEKPPTSRLAPVSTAQPASGPTSRSTRHANDTALNSVIRNVGAQGGGGGPQGGKPPRAGRRGGSTTPAAVPTLRHMPTTDVGRQPLRNGRFSGIPSSSMRLHHPPDSFMSTGRASVASRRSLSHSRSAAHVGRGSARPADTGRRSVASTRSYMSRGGHSRSAASIGRASVASTRRRPEVGTFGADGTVRSSALARTGRSTLAHGRAHFPPHDHDKDVLLQEVKYAEEMASSDKELLRVQRGLIRRVQAKSSDKNHEASILVRAFRVCKPDEFGLISRARFRDGMKLQFGLPPSHADMLFDSVDTKGDKEIKYAQFRTAFEAVDDKHVEPPAVQRHKHFVKPPAPKGTSQPRRLFAGNRIALADLDKTEKQRYRDFSALKKAISHSKHGLKAAFLTRIEHEGGVRTLTQLPYDRVSAALHDSGVQLPPDRLRALIPQAGVSSAYDPAATASGRITFSQLQRATHDYFADLDGIGPSSVTDQAKRMEFRGRFVGCRKVGVGPASKQHASSKDFLAHHDLPHDVRSHSQLHSTPAPTFPAAGTPFEAAEAPEGSVANESSASAPDWQHTSHDNAWKHRWTDKTVEQPRPTAKKMLGVGTNDGHGNVISWQQSAYRPSRTDGQHATGRSIAQMSHRSVSSQAHFATGRNWGNPLI